ncbi:ABC transporter permease subunit [Arthrobacter zhangbolii]|uniref:ABC transporter permease subunit n=1 Tax=Arthrobacter zhangbolii TaxID=2886936 RepID=A0A9X1M601_9MICC|nr:ABC transporter permease subunit [Arthrobacter zhangbolii]MCC3272093.1 ABC transporter permease subunit [Arthrobacter zhangbolii]MCC3294425.1 ABC transporter permease subunit [Arthrobacter zhangbolii]UON92032.1 ABC transporter permease subunit [Arthrobacter zhangbolii]
MGAALQSAARTLLGLALSLAVVGVLWVGLLQVFNVSSYIGKGPLDVWSYLIRDPEAAAHRDLVLGQLGQTLLDAGMGFSAGMAAALAAACLFTLFRGVEHALMPVAMLLRSVPLVALAPMIILVFGRQEAAVAAMGGIVVFFPALVTIVFGLRSASPAMLEVVQVYGGSRLDAFRKVAMPSAAPALFTALRVSIPGALTGALLAEWLATGQGIGYGIVSAVSRARYDQVWAGVVVVTLASILLYAAVSAVEAAVKRRTGT